MELDAAAIDAIYDVLCGKSKSETTDEMRSWGATYEEYREERDHHRRRELFQRLKDGVRDEWLPRAWRTSEP